MPSVDADVLGAAAAWLEQGRVAYLVTVVRTWGSAPCPPGALLAVRDDGEFVGSVSGGCVEEDLAARLAARVGPQTFPALETYGVDREQTHRFGLPCGGRLELLVEQLASPAPLRTLLAAIEERRILARRVCLASGEASLHAAARDAAFQFDGANAVRLFGPQWRLLLIGAGQLSRHVAQMALALDYHVIVCDPREEYARAWSLPGAELDTGMPDEVVRARATDARAAVIALTHDPRLDDLALIEALAAPTFYVGALGSQSNNAKRRARLAELGLTTSQLARLHGPVGLPIGSRTPAEIAVAILAELTAERHGVRLRPGGDETPDLRRPVAACGR